MGNWRTVNIKGTCDTRDVPALKAALEPGDDLSNFHCLSGSHSLSGLSNWAATTIYAIGNLAERDYSIEDVRNQAATLAAVAPSLKIKIHCGGDYEDTACIATITVADGTAETGSPEIDTLESLTSDQMQANFLRALLNARRL